MSASSIVAVESRQTPVLRAQRRLYWWFIAPAAFLYALFFIAPSMVTLWISFNKWSGAGAMQFTGLRNYEILLNDPVFYISFVNTLKILFLVGGATFLISFILTMALRNMSGRRFARAVLFFPNILSGVVISILWGFLFQSDGLVNQLLAAIGVSSFPAWLNEDNLFNIIMAGLVWVSTGFYTTILVAGADRIPKDLYEECELSGANAFQTFWHVTLPLMWEIVGIAAVMWTVSSIKVFEFIFAFAGGAGYLPSTKVWNTALYSYAEAFAATGTPRYGAAAASAMIMLLLIAFLVIFIRRAMRRQSFEF